ncbi:AIG2-like (avirulence induced gene) family protein isoform X2 [Carex rostrata]
MAVASALGSHNVFVYGSLLADEVVHVLLTRAPSSSPALLPNFHRFSVKGRVYPAILPVENKSVSGKVITGITDEELVILDNFEDVEYVRRSVEITLLDTSEKMLAETYVWSDKDDPDLYGEWDFEEWKKLHMTGFLEMTKDFKEILGESDSTKTRVETYESFYKEDSSSDM